MTRKSPQADLLDYGDIASSNFTALLNDTVCVNATVSYNSHDGVTNLADIPAKEIIIVVLMLSLWCGDIPCSFRHFEDATHVAFFHLVIRKVLSTRIWVVPPACLGSR